MRVRMRCVKGVLFVSGVVVRGWEVWEMHEATGWMVSAGHFHTCALRQTEEGGIAECWGHGGQGQTGAPQFEPMMQVSSGHLHSCGLGMNSRIRCWGELAEPPSAGLFKQVSSGNLHACGLKQDGTVKCWGEDHMTGATQAPETQKFAQIAAGLDFTCGVDLADGSVACWGSLRDAAPRDQTFVQVASSSSSRHACGLTSPGKHLVCWGQNVKGEAPGFLRGPFAQLALGFKTTCLVSQGAGALSCLGVLGHIVAAQGGDNHHWLQISLGREHLCGLVQADPNDDSSDRHFLCLHAGAGDLSAATVPLGLLPA